MKKFAFMLYLLIIILLAYTGFQIADGFALMGTHVPAACAIGDSTCTWGFIIGGSIIGILLPFILGIAVNSAARSRG